ncbi:MAG: hypothetical protein HZA36_02885 [Parcubacteria group bacterium]|nr:hypothetical protein [Parcubacteria group bacterium]
MQISKNSLHYRWMKWVYGWYSLNPVPNNLCSYFWKLLFSPVPCFFTMLICIFSTALSLMLALFWWIAGFKPNFYFANLKNSHRYGDPTTTFSCENHKEDLYGKNMGTKSLVAPWEVLLVLGGIILMVTSIKLSLIILGIGVCLWLLVLLAMRGGKLVGPFFHVD